MKSRRTTLMRRWPQAQESPPQVRRAAGIHDKRIGQVANSKRQQPTRGRPYCIGECDWKMTPQRLRPALVGVRDVRRPPAFTAKDARGQCQSSVYEEGRGRQEDGKSVV